MRSKNLALWALYVATAMAAGAQTGTPAPASKAAVAAAPQAGLTATAPEHPATEAQIREYLRLLGTEQVARSVINQLLTQSRASAPPYVPASYFDDLSAALNKLDLAGVYVPVYQKFLSQEEMTAILAFYRSPAGKKLTEVQPALQHDAQMALRTRMSEIGKSVLDKHRDEIEAGKKKYEAEHPAPAQ